MNKKVKPATVSKMADEEIKEAVKKAYGKFARSSKSCCAFFTGTALAKLLGYDVNGMPESVTESFAGCGNPVAISDLKEGEVVLDMGSGAGLDVFMAAKKVGDSGRVIGIDMTPEMIEKARNNAEKLGLKNIEFRLGDLEDIPVEDASVDAVISNCVINLTPNKGKAFNEAYRVLKPGGRMYISDIVIQGKLPKKILESLQAYTNCISGALEEQKYIQTIKDAGFINVEIVGKAKFGPIASDKIKAYKPRGIESSLK